jgi:hypothetical protein
MTIEPLDNPEAERTLRLDIKTLLAETIRLGASAVELHPTGALVMESRDGDRSMSDLAYHVEGLVDSERLALVVTRLKQMCAIRSPSPWWQQKGEFRVDLDIGGWTEMVGVNLTNDPAVHTPQEEHGEIVRLDLAIASWLPAWVHGPFTLAAMPVAFVVGLMSPLGQWGPLLAWGLATFTAIGLSLTYPREWANRPKARAQEVAAVLLFILLAWEAGLWLTLVWTSLTVPSMSFTAQMLGGGLAHFVTYKLWRWYRPVHQDTEE